MSLRYRADIDGLRALAVLLVLIFHFDLAGFGSAGFIGVDVFFVISGFLITAIIQTELAEDRFRLGQFLYRRVRRLYPALLATILLTLAAGWVLFLPHEFRELATQTLWSLLYTINFYLWQNLNYFGVRAETAPLLHMWSLAVEEQFYLIFPIAMMLVYRFAPRLLFAAVIAATLLSFVFGLILSLLKPEAAFYLLPTRAWELLAGAVLAMAVRRWQPGGAWLGLMGPLGLGLIAAAVLLYDPLTQIPGSFALLPVLGAMAVILAGFAPKGAVSQAVPRLLSLGPVVWVGQISYPLYLVHWPIKVFMQTHLLEFSLGWRILGFALSVAVAAALYYGLERPIRAGRWIARPRVYLGTVLGMSLALLALSAVVQRGDGLPGRFTTDVAEIMAYADDWPDAYRPCGYVADRPLPEVCTIGAAGPSPQVLVIGDSHALAFAGAIDVWLEGRGLAGQLLFHHGCMPVEGAGRGPCPAYAEAALAQAVAMPGIEEVVLVSIWRQALPGDGAPFAGRWVPADEVTDVFTDHLSRSVARLTEADKRVTIIEPFFAASRFVPETWARNIAFGRDWPVATPRAEHEAEFAGVLSAFDAVAGPSVRRVSLLDPFCQEGVCRPEIAGVPLFTDNNHLAFAHSARIAEILAEQTPPF
ncbi:MAG: acyltransferase family protein [Pseudomonadota bacterium]